MAVFFAGRGEEREEKDTKLIEPSVWRPPCVDIPHWVDTRLSRFFKRLSSKFKKKKVPSNLLPFQRSILRDLRSNQGIIIANTDKGLGPCAIELSRYIRDALIHLQDESIYRIMSEEEAMASIENLRVGIQDWLNEFESVIGKEQHRYLSTYLDNNEDPFGYFYLLYKIHKLDSLDGVDVIPTRPICSSSGSIDHAIGAYVNEQLQGIAQAQPSFFPNSQALLKDLKKMYFPAGTTGITADATGMYTNIPTDVALVIISEFLWENRHKFSYNYKALIAALELVFRNNHFRFGDLYIKQVSGTAMGKKPAPPWATIFYAIKEIVLLDKFAASLLLYRRYIDDVLAFWLPHPDPVENAKTLQEFRDCMNDFHGLEWTFTKPATSGIAFLDMSLSIKDCRIASTLYEKPLATYLYITPTSAHPPGVTASLVMGNVLRIMQICTDPADIGDKLEVFMERLCSRGHQHATLLPLFEKAITNAKIYLSKSEADKLTAKSLKTEAARRTLYLHVPFMPDNPEAAFIQRSWRDCVAEPPGELPLNMMENLDGEKIDVERMIIAYHRSQNLGNLFSYRKIAKRNGPKVSSFLD